MAVPCPRCAREYDAALFAFGRTLWCTCGARVAAAPRVRRLGPPEGPPRFLADAMLGRLARWLRLLGFDCAFEADVEDADLVRRAVEEARVILTRDRGLAREWRVTGLHVLEAGDTAGQLVEVLRRFALADAVRPFSRCSACNTPLEPVGRARAAASGSVPPRVLAERERFSRCPACERIYWEGSHVARMRRVAEALLAAAGAS